MKKTLSNTLEEEIQNDKKKASKPEVASYSLPISENLHRRITSHMEKLKYVEGKKHSQLNWLQQALKEKLELENNLGQAKTPLREKFLLLKFSTHIKQEIEKRVELEKKFKVSYSKKKWIEEAIHYKLEIEEQKIKDIFEKEFF